MSFKNNWTWKIKDIWKDNVTAEKITKDKEVIEKVYSFKMWDKFWDEVYLWKMDNIKKYAEDKWLKYGYDKDWNLIFYKDKINVWDTRKFAKSDTYTEKADIDWTSFEWDENLIKIVKKLWYDWIKMKEQKDITYMLFNPKILKTKEQLLDIYKKTR